MKLSKSPVLCALSLTGFSVGVFVLGLILCESYFRKLEVRYEA